MAEATDNPTDEFEETPSDPLADVVNTPDEEETPATEPAAAPEAEPAEPVAAAPETPAETETPAEPAPAAAAPPPAPAVAKTPEPPATPPARPLTPAQQRLAQLEAAIDAEDFDPYSKEGKAIQKDYARAAAYVEAEPLREQLTWNNLAEQHELSVKDLKTAWKETVDALPPQHRGSQEVADYAFEQKIKAIKSAKVPVKQGAAAAPAAPAKPAAPVTPKASAKVSPSTIRSSAPVARNEDEEFDLKFAAGANDFLS